MINRPTESGTHEAGLGGWRRKGGLETPLVGRFAGEAKRLVFAPPLWYDALVLLCIIGGPLLAAASISSGGFGIYGDGSVGGLIGVLVLMAGLWAALSNERMACDLRQRTYARLEGQSLAKRITRGSLSEIDALVLTSEELPLPGLGQRTVVYRLVLYWKGSKEPLLVVGREARHVPLGAPIGLCSDRLRQQGLRYAQTMGVRFFDNAHFHSGSPLPVV